MKEYMTQKAIEALEELGRELPFRDRLSCAWVQLGFVDSEEFIQDSSKIREAFTVARNAFTTSDLAVQSKALQSLVFQIIWEAGYSKAVNEANPN